MNAGRWNGYVDMRGTQAVTLNIGKNQERVEQN